MVHLVILMHSTGSTGELKQSHMVQDSRTSVLPKNMTNSSIIITCHLKYLEHELINHLNQFNFFHIFLSSKITLEIGQECLSQKKRDRRKKESKMKPAVFKVVINTGYFISNFELFAIALLLTESYILCLLLTLWLSNILASSGNFYRVK